MGMEKGAKKQTEGTEEYLQTFRDLLEMSPFENQFQSLLVYPILKKVVSEINVATGENLKVVDCHNFRQFNTKTHTRREYSFLPKAVPDLLIAKNFIYHNKGEDGNSSENIKDEQLEVRAAVEVKEPNNKWMLDREVDGDKEYKNALYLELFPSLCKNKRVILTNVRRWEFYEWDCLSDGLKSSVMGYVKILKLYGSNDTEDYEAIEKSLQNRDGRKEELLKLIHKNLYDMKEAKISRKDLQEIIQLTDDIYLDDIKECIKKSKKHTIEIIANNKMLDVGSGPIDFECKSDVEKLYEELNFFLTTRIEKA